MNEELKTKKPNVVRDKSLTFAIAVVELCKTLQDKKEFILSKQLMRSGTAIGALVREAEQAESSKDFIHKLSIAFNQLWVSDITYWKINTGKRLYISFITDVYSHKIVGYQVAERINGIIKDEYLETYDINNLKDAKELLKAVVDLYNSKRPHMSNSNFTPNTIHHSKTKIKTKRLRKNYYRKQNTSVNPIQD